MMVMVVVVGDKATGNVLSEWSGLFGVIGVERWLRRNWQWRCGTGYGSGEEAVTAVNGLR